MRIPFAPWAPDQASFGGPGTINVKNVYPVVKGYKPIFDLVAFSTNALDGKAIGAFSATDDTGTTHTFIGTVDKLYTLSGNAFVDISKAGGYNVSAEDGWKFAQFGSIVIAVSPSNAPQYFDMDSSSLFDDLAGSPPEARAIAIVRDFVLLGNTTTSAQQLQWSSFNNCKEWSPGTNQGDTQQMFDGGWVQAVTGGEVGGIFQERAITRMSYVGPPLIFQFDQVISNIGVTAPRSVIKVGNNIYFWGTNGFYSTDLNSVTPIGNERVNRWFTGVVQPDTLTSITAGSDPVNNLIYWSFVSTSSPDGVSPDMLLIYNWAIDQFTYAALSVDLIYSGLSEGFTLEQLSAIYPNLETVPLSFDSRAWTGGNQTLLAVNSSHQLCSFSGSALAATIATPEFEAVPFSRSQITNVRPLCDTAAATISILSREKLADSQATLTASTMQSNGDIPTRAAGRYHTAQLNIPYGTTWTYALGLDVDSVADGMR